jgi:hypothetical protein
MMTQILTNNVLEQGLTNVLSKKSIIESCQKNQNRYVVYAIKNLNPSLDLHTV